MAKPIRLWGKDSTTKVGKVEPIRLWKKDVGFKFGEFPKVITEARWSGWEERSGIMTPALELLKKAGSAPPVEYMTQAPLGYKIEETPTGFATVPIAIIKQAPPEEPKEKDSWLMKVGKFLMPRWAERKYLDAEPTKRELMWEREDSRFSYYRTKEFEKLYRQEVLEDPVISKDYIEPEGFAGSVWEGMKFGYQTSIKQGAAYFVEATGRQIGSPERIKEGIYLGDKTTIEILKRPELYRPEDLKPFFEGGVVDKRWYGRTMGETLPFIFTTIASATIGGIIGGPTGAAIGGYGSVYVLEKGNSYKRYIDEGMAPDKADTASTVYGVISALIENAFGIRPAKIGTRVATRSFKTYAMKELPKIGTRMLKIGMAEGGEEVAQGITENLISTWVMSEGDILTKDLAEEFVAGFIASIPFGLAGVRGTELPIGLTIKEVSPTPEDSFDAYIEREFGKATPKEVEKAMTLEIQKEVDTIKKEAEGQLFKDIKSLGGIKAYAKGLMAEELRPIPLSLKNNTTGVTLDEMTSSLRERGYRFESDTELLEAILDIQTMARPIPKSKTVRALKTMRTNMPKVISESAKLIKLEKKVRALVREAKVPGIPVKKAIRIVTKQVKPGLPEFTRRMRDLVRGMREGRIFTKKEIMETQTSILDRIDDFKLEAKDKVTFMRTVKNIQTQKQLKKALPDIQKRISDFQHNSLMNEIRAELKEPLVTKAKVSKYSPYVTKMLKSFKGQLSFTDPTSLKYKKLEKTSQWIKDNPHENLPDNIMDELDELDRTHLNLLTTEELAEQLESIRILKTQGKTYKRLKIKQMKDERTKIAEGFINIITEGKEVSPEVVTPDRRTINDKILDVFWKMARPIKTIKDKKVNTYNLRQLNSDNLFDILDETAGTTPYNGKIHRYFQEVANKSRDTEIILNQGDFSKIQNKIMELGIESEFSKKITIDNITLTRNDLIDIYISNHDKAQLESMIEGNKFSQDFINKSIANLSNEEKAFGDFVLEFWEESYTPQNDVYRQSNFMDMPKNEGYSPMHKDMDYVKEQEINVAQQQLQYARASVPKKQTKIRTGSLAPIKLGALEKLVISTTRKNHYIAWELPVKEMNSILTKIKPAVTQEHGKNFYPVLRGWLKGVAGDGRYDKTWLAKKLLQARKGFTKALIANVITPIKQTISMSSFLTEMNEIELAKGLGSYWTNRKEWNAFWKNVPQIQNRSETLTRDIGEISKSRTAVDKVMKRKSKSELTVAGVRFMDRLTVRSGATAMYLARGGTLKGEINMKAMEKTLGVVRRTQPTGDIKDLSSLQRGGALEKLGTMFMNQLNKYYNVLYHNVRAYSKGRVGKGQLARTILYAWIVPQIAFEFITSGGTADEEDYLKAIAFGPFKYLLFVGTIFNAIQSGFDYQFSAIEDMPNELVRSGREILQGDILEGLFGAGEIVLEYKGYPVNQPKRTISGIYDLVTGETDDWRRLIWSEWALKEKKETTKPSKPGVGPRPIKAKTTGPRPVKSKTTGPRPVR